MVTRHVVWFTIYTYATESGVSLGKLIMHIPWQVDWLPQEWSWSIYPAKESWFPQECCLIRVTPLSSTEVSCLTSIRVMSYYGRLITTNPGNLSNFSQEWCLIGKTYWPYTQGGFPSSPESGCQACTQTSCLTSPVYSCNWEWCLNGFPHKAVT